MVYLASRGLDHQKQTADAIRIWRDAERRAIERCAAGNASVMEADGTVRPVGGMPRFEASDIENRSRFQLMDFWDQDRSPHPTEATLLRVVEWCGVTGFDSWWRRLTREAREDILLGGPDPEHLVWWLFDLSRSGYAIELMGPTLIRALDVVSVTTNFRRQPWIYGHDKRRKDGFREYVFDEDLAYASALAWCTKRLSPNTGGDLVDSAVGSLAKHQLETGAWAYSTASDEPSIEATALAIHAIRTAGHPRSEAMISDAAAWLLKQQDQAGYWSEESSQNPVYLTVLVLDALELALNGRQTTFAGPKATRPTARSTAQKPASPAKAKKRFRVGLSFPGELRKDVKGVADKLRRELGAGRVFYDAYFKSELARPNLDVYLQNIYLRDCDLVVIWASPDYAKKEWCGIEWRAIRNIINQRRDDEIMIVKKGDFSIEGLFEHDGYIDGTTHSTSQVANMVLERISAISNRRAPR